ncbi:MAG: carboxypeptidase-like regulatory domain-containing protein [bacterium]
MEGTIQDALTGLPTKGATVSLGNRTTTSDKNGRFTLWARTLTGELTINASGYEPYTCPVERKLIISLLPFPEKTVEYWFNYWKRNFPISIFALLLNSSKS